MASIDSGVETGNESNDSPIALDCTKDCNSVSVLPPPPSESSFLYPIFTPRAGSLSFDLTRFSSISENAGLRGNLNHMEPTQFRFLPDRFKSEALPRLPMIDDKSGSSSSDPSDLSSTSHFKLISEAYANEPLARLPLKTGPVTNCVSNSRMMMERLALPFRSRSSSLKELRNRTYHSYKSVEGKRRMRLGSIAMRNESDFWPQLRWSYDFSGEKKPQIRSLFVAAQLNDVSRVRYLLQCGVSPNCFDSQERTPLHLAACKGYAEVVKLLLLFGADPDLRDGVGNTALHLAVCTNHLEVVSLLLKAGIDVCSSDFKGRSPLQLAQSKLKILQRSQDIDNIKSQVIQVIDMLMSFINKNESSTAEDLDFLTAFQNKFKISDSAEQVGTDIKDLLAKLDNLSVSPAATNNNS